jgi:pyridoxine kinase
MNILSIQSHVAYGHVGNSAAVFPLQRLGVEVWPVDTVQYSNHTRYESWKGRVFEAELIREVVLGIEQRGVLSECDGVLSGYMGSVDIGGAILDAVASVKRANPAARYCCDPVIGDVDRGVFVHAGIPEFMETQALPAADIRTSSSSTTCRAAPARRSRMRCRRSTRCRRSGPASSSSPRCGPWKRRPKASTC